MRRTPRANRAKVSVARIIGLVILAILGVLLFWNVIWRISNNHAIAKLEAAARQRGEPVTVAELKASYPPIADEENIHRALVKVWASEDPDFWNAYMKGTRPLPDQQHGEVDPDLPVVGRNARIHYTNDLSVEDLPAVRAFLTAKKPHMDGVRAALQLKGYRANYDFDQTYAILLPELAKLKREAQLFSLDAWDAIAAQDNTRALAAIADITRIGNALKNDPLLIAQLVRIACYNIAISTAERLLKERQLSETECARLEQILEEMKPDNSMKRALAGERVFAWTLLDGSADQLAQFINQPDTDNEESSPAAIAFGLQLLRVSGLAGAEKRLMGETFDQAIACLAKPDYASTDEMRDIFNTMNVKARRFPPKLFTLMLMPALEKSDQKAARLEALRRCAITALAVERYRLSHNGSLPAQLSELGTPPLDDPFTGQPLLFKQTERGYAIYSVGPNRKDEDGLIDLPKSSSPGNQGDVGFRVEHK